MMCIMLTSGHSQMDPRLQDPGLFSAGIARAKKKQVDFQPGIAA